VHDQNDVWLVDETNAFRFSFGGAGAPVWSPDSRQLVYSHGVELHTKPADSSKDEELVPMPVSWQGLVLEDWSPDGRFLVYHEISRQTGYDLWIVPMEGDRKPLPFLQTKFDEKYARFSPDGHWLAYVSTETGRAEVWLRAFVEPQAAGIPVSPGAVFQLSTVGGLSPVWRRDSKELYWVGPDSRIMAASITMNGKTLEPGMPVALFQAPIFGGGLDVNTVGTEFDVAPDGRFLIDTVKDGSATAITLLQNWKPK
jgi:Tol biopolymer transport system component